MEDARIELLQRMPVFGGIRAEVLRFLLGLCPIMKVRAGEYFFREHDAADSMFVLEAGQVAVLKTWQSEESLLRTLRTGDCFGALEDCAAVQVSAASLYRVYEHDLEQFALIQMNMGREISRRLREADERLFRTRMGTSGADMHYVFLAS
jgi:CRP-like cAMP-binding protein